MSILFEKLEQKKTYKSKENKKKTKAQLIIFKKK